MAMSKKQIILLSVGGAFTLCFCVCLGMCGLIVGVSDKTDDDTNQATSSPTPSEAKPSAPISETPPAVVTPKPVAAISEVDWSALDKIYNLSAETTELQKKEHWKQFKGKKIRWTGTVTEVEESWGSMTLQVKMNSDTLTSDLMIYLDRSEKSKALRLKPNDRVTFSGVLDDWGTIMPITLKQGKIIE